MSPCTLYNVRHMAGAERVHNKIFYLELGPRKGWEQPLPLRSARGTTSPAELILHKDAIVGGKQLSGLGWLLLSEPKSKSMCRKFNASDVFTIIIQ